MVRRVVKFSLLATLIVLSFTVPFLAVTAKRVWEPGPIVIDEYGAFTWEDAVAEPWCKGSGTPDDPYIIKNLVIDGYGSRFCIAISNSEVYFKIMDSKLYNTKPLSFNDPNAGIVLINTKNGVIFKNQILNNGWQGSGHGVGIALDGSNDNKIQKNIISGTAMSGIYLIENSENNKIQGNIVSNNGAAGISLENSDNNVIQKNTVGRNIGPGIYLDNSDYNFIVDNYCNENMWGILLWDSTISTLGSSDYNFLTRNDCVDNIETGIVIGLSNHNIVNKNLCKGNTWGISIGNYASYNLITQNDCIMNLIGSPTSGGGGIVLHDFAYLNEIRGNDCTDNLENGILVVNNPWWPNTIENNLCKKNSYGISMISSNNQFISGNDIVENLVYGLTLAGSLSGNIINHNNFIDNTNQAWDDNQVWGANNWDGNYWSDYPGIDINGDGIGDTDLPWPFNWGYWGSDFYPFMEKNGWETEI